jgi:hypothetical protein
VPRPWFATINYVSAILDDANARHLPAAHRGAYAPRLRRRPSMLMRGGHVVALRQRRTIALGSLADRALVTGDRLVTAHDEAGHTWWIPADAVWSDCDTRSEPDHPRPIGVATAATRESALIKGLSDRLGWEAVLELERGHELPAATSRLAAPVINALVLDGRLGHDVPTVVVLAAETVRWGAGSTWDGAVRRALYGDDAETDARQECRDVSAILGPCGLGVAAVDLGSEVLSTAGVVRCSVQLVARDGAVRSWDADVVN